jgi:hypothetical protein
MVHKGLTALRYSCSSSVGTVFNPCIRVLRGIDWLRPLDVCLGQVAPARNLSGTLLPHSLLFVVSVTSKAKGTKMAVIRFTARDALQATLPQITPDHSGEVNLHIEPAHDCDGVRCGGRLESALSAEHYSRWLDCHEWRPPMPRHSHLIVSGKRPDAHESIFSILTD